MALTSVFLHDLIPLPYNTHASAHCHMSKLSLPGSCVASLHEISQSLELDSSIRNLFPMNSRVLYLFLSYRTYCFLLYMQGLCAYILFLY